MYKLNKNILTICIQSISVIITKIKKNNDTSCIISVKVMAMY